MMRELDTEYVYWIQNTCIGYVLVQGIFVKIWHNLELRELSLRLLWCVTRDLIEQLGKKIGCPIVVLGQVQ